MEFCIWLVPGQFFHMPLQSEIKELARKYNAGVFEPHMTLFCGETKDINKTKQQLHDIMVEQTYVKAKATGIEYTDHYFKTLFVQFEPEAHLKELNKQLHTKLDKSSEYQFNPHLSLLYANIPDAEKANLAKKIWDSGDLMFTTKQEIKFERVYLVTGTDEESKRGVESWKVEKKIELKEFKR